MHIELEHLPSWIASPRATRSVLLRNNQQSLCIWNLRTFAALVICLTELLPLRMRTCAPLSSRPMTRDKGPMTLTQPEHLRLRSPAPSCYGMINNHYVRPVIHNRSEPAHLLPQFSPNSLFSKAHSALGGPPTDNLRTCAPFSPSPCLPISPSCALPIPPSPCPPIVFSSVSPRPPRPSCVSSPGLRFGALFPTIVSHHVHVVAVLQVRGAAVLRAAPHLQRARASGWEDDAPLMPLAARMSDPTPLYPGAPPRERDSPATCEAAEC